MQNDNLKEIYKVEAAKYNKTRDIHWKMNIAIWTVLIVAIYAKAHDGFEIGLCSGWIVLIYASYIGLHLFFIYNIHGSLNRSLGRMNNMATLLLQPEIEWKNIWDIGKTNKYWEYFQVLLTCFLIAMFHFIHKGTFTS